MRKSTRNVPAWIHVKPAADEDPGQDVAGGGDPLACRAANANG